MPNQNFQGQGIDTTKNEQREVYRSILTYFVFNLTDMNIADLCNHLQYNVNRDHSMITIRLALLFTIWHRSDFFLVFFNGFLWRCVTCTCKGHQWCPVTLVISLIGFILFEFVWQPRCLSCVVDKTKAMEKLVIMSAPKHTRATFKHLKIAQQKRPWMCSSARGLCLLYLQ